MKQIQNTKYLVGLWLMTMLVSCAPSSNNNKLTVTNPECEYLTNPLGIDNPTPRLSWKLVSQQQGVMQKAWQILAASNIDNLKNNNGDLWNSDTVYSDQSTEIKFAGKRLESRQKVYWKVRVWDNRGNVSDWSEVSSWETALLNQADWKAKWIGDKDGVRPQLGQKNPALYFRKTFEVNELPKQARTYISGVGYYELYINGEKVGDHLLSPNQTNYDRMIAASVDRSIANDGGDLTHFAQRVLYETFDITDYLIKGENTVLVTVGNGWYLRTTREEFLPMSYDNPRMIAQVEILSPENKLQTVVSNNRWKVTTNGPIVNNSIREGEVYDARIENPAWYKSGFDDSNWKNAEIVRAPKGKLHAQMSPPDRITKLIKPVSVKEVKKGVYRYDFGTMFAGWIEIKKKGERGKRLKIVYFEDHGNTYDQRDIYIFKGEETETWEPRFTWHAFRYAEVTSDTPMTLDDVMGKVVHTDVKQVGSFNSSNELFNTISNDYLKTQWDNMHGGVPSDCPHRERRGYTGDGQIAAQAAIYYLDMRAFYTKWLNDISDSQNRKTGYVPTTAPYHGGGGGVAWGSAYVIIPWYMYYYYGDKEILRNHYDGMKKYIDYLTNRTDKDGLIYIKPDDGWDLGEWVPPVETVIPKEFVASAYYYYDLILLAKIADAIDKKSVASQLRDMAAKTQQAFNKRYLNREKSSYSIGWQGANVFPLAFGLVPDEKIDDVFSTLVNHIENVTNGHFDTGMMATPYVLEVLTKYNRPDLAYTVMNQKDFPSFGYNIERGATTLWETWSGKESHSHPMFGSVCAWFFQGLGGINPDEKVPGFKHVIIKPSVVNDLDFVNTTFESVYGTISSEWQVKEENLELRVTIPANTTATVSVPAKDAESVTIDTGNISQVNFENNRATYEISSGNYTFKSVDISAILKTPMLTAPVIEPSDTTVFIPEKLSVNIRQNTPNANIRYTINGSEPDENSQLFTKPFLLKKSATVKAKLFRKNTKPGFTRSSSIVFIDSEKNGIEYKYYVGSWSMLPNFNSIQAVRTGKIYNFSLDGIENLSDRFALVLSTTMKIRDAGKYTFTLNSNDGSKLYIDGRLIVDSDGLHGFMAQKGDVSLKKGDHKVVLEYFQAGGGRGLELYIESDKMEKQIVPADILAPSDLP